MAQIVIGSTAGSRPYATLDVNLVSQDINANTSTVSYALVLHRPSRISSSASKSWSCTIDGQTFSGSGSIGGSGDMVLLSGNATVGHDANGNKVVGFMGTVRLDITWSGSWLGTISANGYIGLPTIARTSKPTLNASLFTITKNNSNFMRIYTNRASTAFTHHIYYSINGGPETGIVPDVTDFYDWYFPNTLANSFPNSAKVTGYIRLYTFNGDTNMGSQIVYFDMQLANDIVPSISSVSIVEATANLATKFGAFVKSQSTLKITTTASGIYGSTIKSYSHSVENATYTGNPATTGVISTSGTVAIKTTVTDSRGRTATKTTNVTIVDWFAPSITAFSVSRANSDGTLSEEGTRAKFTYSYSVAPVDNKNDKDIKIQYLNSDTWTTLTTLSAYSASEQTYLSEIDFTVDSSFTFRIVANDYFVTDSKGIEKTMGPSFSLINWNASGRSMSFGKPSSRGPTEKVIDFAMPMYEQWGGQIRNGLAYYPTGGADANITLEEIALCSKNIPFTGGLAYVRTIFYTSKTSTSNRTQIAYPYNLKESCYHRYYFNGTWSEWRKHLNTDDPRVYVIAGTVIKNPANNSSVQIHTIADILGMFESRFGFTPSQYDVGIEYYNGDGNACGAHVNGAMYLSGWCIATLNSIENVNMRINYCYTTWH